MMRMSSPAALTAVLLLAATPVLPHATAGAQVPVHTIDVGGPPRDTTTRACLSDSIVAAALAAFNRPDAIRILGGSQAVPAGDTIRGSYNVFQGKLKLAGTVQGNVVVLNGDARVTSTGVVTGAIMVIGGQLVLDPGATVGRQFNCEGQPALMKLPDGTVARLPPRRSVSSITSALAWTVGDYRFTPHVGIGQYNRVEALPAQLGVNVSRPLGPIDTVAAQAFGILRTGRDPSGSRPSIGWHASASYQHGGSIPLTVAIEGGSTVMATSDQPYSGLESAISAFVLRRDYADWFLRRGASVTATVRPWREVTLVGAYDVSRQTTVPATDAFSLFRNTEGWRSNPLIDDGTYHTVTGRLLWDARDPVLYPVLSWFVRAELHHVSSSNLTPVSLPTTIRDAVPTTGYHETDGELDIRGSLRIGPEQRLNFRVFGGGYLTGDPLTIQRRRSIGSADALLGYEFRGVNCDRRRKPDPATPALCDRSAAIQAEYHRTLAVDLNTRIGGYNIGIRKPDLVFFADAGSAWLAGDSAGRVPTNRIQSLAEWRSDVGVGITSGPIGLFLAKALTDALSIRLTLLFNYRL